MTSDDMQVQLTAVRETLSGIATLALDEGLGDGLRTCIDGITQLLESLDGIAVVPREATDAMIEAGFGTNPKLGMIWTAGIGPDDAKTIWRSMIAAAEDAHT